MYYIGLNIRTHHSHEEHASIDQAYVECWINEEEEAAAVEVAKTIVQEEPWEIEEVSHVTLVTVADYTDDPERMALYKQATVDGNVVNFIVCPRFPLYFVQFDVSQPEIGEDEQPTEKQVDADATLWVSNETVVADEPSPDDIDMLVEDFWTELRVERALHIAQSVVENEGWTINDTVKHWPFTYRILEKQPDLAEYVEGAETDGVSLVIWDKTDSDVTD